MTVMISNEADIKKIQGALKEISDAMIRMQAEKDLIKTIKDDLAEQFKDKLTKKQINKLAKTYYNQTFDKEVAENEEFAYLYETITK